MASHLKYLVELLSIIIIELELQNQDYKSIKKGQSKLILKCFGMLNGTQIWWMIEKC